MNGKQPYKDAKTNPNFRKKRVDNKDATSIVCTRCSIEKPVSEFHWRKDNQNYRTTCKSCWRILCGPRVDQTREQKRITHIKNRIKRLKEKGLSNERIEVEETLMKAQELVTVEGTIVRISNINLSVEEQGMFLKYPNGTMIRICGPNAGPEEVNEWFKVRGMKKPT